MFGWGVNKGPTVAQKAVGDLLFNDAIHVLSSFQLNRIASLTYGDDVCDQLFEMLEELMRKPEDHSVLTLQKSLVVTRHVMIYGSEKTVNSAIVLQRGVEQLLEYNTVLINARKQGAAGFFQKIKGGGVDEVRSTIIQANCDYLFFRMHNLRFTQVKLTTFSFLRI